MPTMLTRRSSRTATTLVVAIGMLILGAGTAVPAVRAGTSAIEIVDFAFAPGTLTIAVGDTVTWTNADPVVHTATSTSGAFDSGDLATGESYSVTFTAAGTYDYLCTPHPTMTGRIVVEAAPTATATPAAGGGLPNVAVEPTPTPASSALIMAGIGLLMLGLVVGARSRRRAHRG